ncbi:MAG TPA: amino acid ABC transporter substrate-binding protein [Candidatus Bathyarchaeia archaeon]|nr:amino acid ABC transporter substrate-binding protein [Candidatus Bathyarchaeia archaeon]
MSRRLLSSLAIAALVAVALTVPAGTSAQEDTLSRIKRTGALSIGYRESSPPFSFVASGETTPKGYSIDLCLRIADSIKKELNLTQLDIKWVKVTPESRFAAINNGSVDIECGSTTKTLGRMAQADFTVVTFLDGGSLLTATAAKIKRLPDVAGKRVGVVPGTTTEGALRDMIVKLKLPGVTLLGVKDHAEGVAALEAGRLDAYASDRTLLAGLAAASKDPTKLYLMEDFISYEPYALMVRRGDPNFHLSVDRALIRLYRSAEVVPIYEKWFGPFPESNSLIAAVYVLNSFPD